MRGCFADARDYRTLTHGRDKDLDTVRASVRDDHKCKARCARAYAYKRLVRHSSVG
jgi:hypothetical protein